MSVDDRLEADGEEVDASYYQLHEQGPADVLGELDELDEGRQAQESIIRPSEIYGFVLWISVAIGYILFVGWAFIPDDVLFSMGVTYSPSKYWALVIPAWILVALLFLCTFYSAYNLASTNPLHSIHTVSDQYTRYMDKTERQQLLLVDDSVPDAADLPIQTVNMLLYRRPSEPANPDHRRRLAHTPLSSSALLSSSHPSSSPLGVSAAAQPVAYEQTLHQAPPDQQLNSHPLLSERGRLQSQSPGAISWVGRRVNSDATVDLSAEPSDSSPRKTDAFSLSLGYKQATVLGGRSSRGSEWKIRSQKNV
eukprot:gb/GEZN01007312.1/.p1 GENE.gb/GEZN01007312.1/~~gb/GEZN01007312.1/.p1  ORF type:complete len:308 (-),score=37.55 gb/GEZN01007312.1/:521-1444(-)